MRIMQPVLARKKHIPIERDRPTKNTTRVTEDEPLNMERLIFACVELMQNAGDGVWEVYNEAATDAGKSYAPVTSTKKKIEWKLGEECFLGVYVEKNGVRIRQIGLPLSIDAINSGTKSKAKGGGKAAGGFGDGLKTAATYLVSMGARLDLRFYNFGEGSELVWKWRAGVFEKGCEEKTLGIEFERGDEPAVPPPFPADAPIMETFVHTDGSRIRASALKEAVAQALRRFVWLLYEYDDDDLVFTVPGRGEWRRKESMRCLVESFCGVSFAQPLYEGSPCVDVMGIWYRTHGAPPNFVIRIKHTNGHPDNEDPLFENPYRVVSQALVGRLYSRQLLALLGVESLREKLVQVLMPLMRGGSSFVIEGSYPGALATQALGQPEINAKVRGLLLFHRLSPPTWGLAGVSEAEERRLVQARVDRAVFTSTETEAAAKFLQFLRGEDPRCVLVVEPVANQELFRLTDTHGMELAAAEELGRKVRAGGSRIVQPLHDALLPAVAYMSDGAVTVAHVFREPGGDVQPYSFRPRGSGVMVIFQPLFNAEEMLREIGVHMQVLATLEQARRTQEFMLAFFSREAAMMTRDARIKDAIRQAGDRLPRKRARSIHEVHREEQAKRLQVANDADRAVRGMLPVLDPFKSAAKRVALPPVALFSASDPVSREPPVLSQGGVAGASGPRAAEEPEGTIDVAQRYDAQLDILLPAASDGSELPSDLSERLATFHLAVALLRAATHTGRVQFKASYSPRADWAGLHQATGLCIVNIAHRDTVPAVLRTLVHEMAHEHASHHDVRFVQAADMISERVYAHLLAQREAR